MIESANAAGPRLLDREHRAITVGIITFVTLVAFEGTSVITALPVVARDLDAVASLAWIINAFVAASLLGQVLSGEWGDRFGPRRPLIYGIVAFGVGAAVSGFAATFPILLVGRALQGFGAGAGCRGCAAGWGALPDPGEAFDPGGVIGLAEPGEAAKPGG